MGPRRVRQLRCRCPVQPGELRSCASRASFASTSPRPMSSTFRSRNMQDDTRSPTAPTKCPICCGRWSGNISIPSTRSTEWARQFLRHDGRTDTTELLAAMTHAIRQNLTYVTREESGVQDPVRTLRLGSGSCRDFTVLMMEAVRSLGLAAHFVSGYLYVPEGRVTKAGGSAAAPPTPGCAFICRAPAGSSSTRRTASSATTI